MENQKQGEVSQCSHPPNELFEQRTNNGVSYDLILCRRCGRLVERKPKKIYT